MATYLTLDDIIGIDKLKFPVVINGTRYEHKKALFSYHDFKFKAGAAIIILSWQIFSQPSFWVVVDGVPLNYDRGSNLGIRSVEAIGDPKLRAAIAKAFADLQGEELRLDPTKRHTKVKEHLLAAEKAQRDLDELLQKAIKKI